MKKLALLHFFLCCNFLPAQTDTTLTFSEIMFRPEGSDNEFAEVYNLSETDTIDLAGYKLIYYTSSPDLIIEHEQGTRLPPNSFAVIFEGDYDFTSGVYNDYIPGDALVLKIDNKAFGSSGMSNSSDRQVVLISPAGDTVDVYTYSANNSAGISDEKILVTRDNSDGNWTNSTIVNGTPGKINSVTPKQYDLAVTSIGINPEVVFEDSSAQLEIEIKNFGSKAAEIFAVQLFDDLNADSTGQPGETLYSRNFTDLNPADSTTITYSIDIIELREYNLICKVTFDEDENPSNNDIYFSFTPNPKPNKFNDVVINELMHSPGSGEPEWIELYNNTAEDININSWRIKDRSTSAVVSNEPVYLYTGDYIVIGKDESISDYFEITSQIIIVPSMPSLNNSGDDIVLLDSLNRVIDSVSYQSSWGGKNGLSLERLATTSPSNDSTNWASSVSFNCGTPGAINSVTQKELDLKLSGVFVEPDPVIEGSNASISSTIKNTGNLSADKFTVTFYYDTNGDSLVQTSELVSKSDFSNLAGGDSTTAVYTITEPEKGVRQYIVEVEFDGDEFPEDNIEMISFVVYERPADYNDVVINEIMYKPSGDEPEWIELFNNSTTDWNIQDWSLSDRSSQVQITEDSLLFNSNSYLVLSNDESIFNYYDITAQVIIVNLPSLNNSDDGLKVIDNLDRIIDSVNYKSTWGGNSDGASLERKSAYGSGIDSTNWAGSGLSGPTPGELNSITPREYDLELTDFNFIDEFAVVGRELTASVQIKNIGLNAVNSASVEVYKFQANDTTSVYETEFSSIAPGDSIYFEFGNNNITEGQNLFGVRVTTEQDDRPGNNFAEAAITGIVIVDIPGDIVVNEIMYTPLSSEPEWIEVYNKNEKVVNLENYKIADQTDTVMVIDSTITLNPGNYFVFARDSSFLDRYSISDYAIAHFPSLNNSGDDVVLLNYINEIIDSVAFTSSWGGRGGASLERIDPFTSSCDSANWSSARVDSGGTPGAINTVSRKDYDAAVTQIIFNPKHPFAGEKVHISTVILNKGKQNITCSAKLFENIGTDSMASITPPVDIIDNISLNAGDSVFVNFNYVLNDITHPIDYLAMVYTDGDQDSANNYYAQTISPGYNRSCVKINEIHYNPANGEPEWIELLNTASFDINLQEWLVSDVLTTPKEVPITNEEHYISPNEFVVIVRDSSIIEYHSSIPCEIIKTSLPNMNNDKDGIVIKDANGNLIDSVVYKSIFGGTNGYSLERISAQVSGLDSANWASSVDIEGSTPGRTNSVLPRSFDLKAVQIFTDPEFPVLNDEVTVSLKVRNIGLNTAENFNVEFNLSQNQGTSGNSQITGLTLFAEDSLIVTSETSFILQEETIVICKIIFNNDENSRNNKISNTIRPGFKEKSVIITEFMSQPEEGGCEWIELMNNSDAVISLSNWSVSDVLPAPTKSTITSDTVFIDAGEFFIVASDTTGFRKPHDVKIFQSKFGVLGNSEDGIIVYDFKDAIIDSLFYDRTWDITKGKSEERISADTPSGLKNNWATSLSLFGSTPGQENSISGVTSYAANSVVINEILFEPGKGYCEFAEFINISDNPVNLGGWTITDEADNSTLLSPTNHNLQPGAYYVVAADSSILENYDPDYLTSAAYILDKSDLGFSNSGESLVMNDIFGVTIDSVKYSSKWHNRNIVDTKNHSLEKISPSLSSNDDMNWSTSVGINGATPGYENSIYTEPGQIKSGIDISPNPFSPDNDGFEDFTIITYNLKNPTNQIRIKIFDDHGRKVRTLANNLSVGSEGSIIFNGLDDHGHPLRIGMYIVYLEAVGNKSGFVESHKKVVVVARKF